MSAHGASAVNSQRALPTSTLYKLDIDLKRGNNLAIRDRGGVGVSLPLCRSLSALPVSPPVGLSVCLSLSLSFSISVSLSLSLSLSQLCLSFSVCLCLHLCRFVSVCLFVFLFPCLSRAPTLSLCLSVHRCPSPLLQHTG